MGDNRAWGLGFTGQASFIECSKVNIQDWTVTPGSIETEPAQYSEQICDMWIVAPKPLNP